MFTQISWSAYLTTVFVLAAGYYLIIGYKYFRSDLLQLFAGRKISSSDQNSVKEDIVPVKENMQTAFEKQDLFPLAQSCADEIQAFAGEASSSKLNNEEVQNNFRKVLGKYPVLKDSSFRDFIDNMVTSESESNLSINLTSDEVAALWA